MSMEYALNQGEMYHDVLGMFYSVQVHSSC